MHHRAPQTSILHAQTGVMLALGVTIVAFTVQPSQRYDPHVVDLEGSGCVFYDAPLPRLATLSPQPHPVEVPDHVYVSDQIEPVELDLTDYRPTASTLPASASRSGEAVTQAGSGAR